MAKKPLIDTVFPWVSIMFSFTQAILCIMLMNMIPMQLWAQIFVGTCAAAWAAIGFWIIYLEYKERNK
jgi:amino acid permease